MKPVGAVIYFIALVLGAAVGAFIFMDALFPFFLPASSKYPLLAACMWWGMFGVLFLSSLLVPARSPASGVIFLIVSIIIGVMLLALHFLA